MITRSSHFLCLTKNLLRIVIMDEFWADFALRRFYLHSFHSTLYNSLHQTLDPICLLVPHTAPSYASSCDVSEIARGKNFIRDMTCISVSSCVMRGCRQLTGRYTSICRWSAWTNLSSRCSLALPVHKKRSLNETIVV